MIVRTTPDFRIDAAPLHVVLVEPEIPQNSGNIARLCAGTGAWLHLVEPLGYRLEDRYLKRAGLDYWPAVRLSVHAGLDELAACLPWDRTWLFTTRGSTTYWEVAWPEGAVLVFGRESTGLPSSFIDAHAERQVKVPMRADVRSLNVANTVALGLYEALRQRGWTGT